MWTSSEATATTSYNLDSRYLLFASGKASHWAPLHNLLESQQSYVGLIILLWFWIQLSRWVVLRPMQTLPCHFSTCRHIPLILGWRIFYRRILGDALQMLPVICKGKYVKYIMGLPASLFLQTMVFSLICWIAYPVVSRWYRFAPEPDWWLEVFGDHMPNYRRCYINSNRSSNASDWRNVSNNNLPSYKVWIRILQDDWYHHRHGMASRIN